MDVNTMPPKPRPPQTMDGHVVILGLGHVGFRVFELLRRLGEAVAVADQRADPERVAQVERHGGMFVAGDIRNPEVLRQCRVHTAKALLALTDQELANLSVAMDARLLNPGAKIVIRLFDQELARHIRQVFAIQTVLSTSAIAAPLFAAAIFDDHNLACFQSLGVSCAIVHWRVAEGAALVGEPIALFAEREDCRPLLLQRDGELSEDFAPGSRFLPGDRVIGLRVEAKANGNKAKLRRWPWLRAAREFFGHMPKVARLLLLGVLALLLSGIPLFRIGLGLSWLDACYFAVTTLTTTGYGDINLLNAPAWVKGFGTLYMLCGAALMASLVGMVTDYLLSARIREWLGVQAAPLRGHVILVGVGGLGARIAEDLRQRGRAVACCLAQPGDRFAGALRAEVKQVDGDPRNPEVLARAGVASAAAVLAITEDDVLNLSVGLLAKQMNPEVRAIVRVFDGHLAEKLKDHLRIDQVHSVSATAAPSFAAALYGRNLTAGFVWGDYLAWISEGPAGPPPVGEGREAYGIALRGVAGDADLALWLLPLAAP